MSALDLLESLQYLPVIFSHNVLPSLLFWEGVEASPWVTASLALGAVMAIALLLCLRALLLPTARKGSSGDSVVDVKKWIQLFNLAKTAYHSGNKEKLMQRIETENIDPNSYTDPKTGLTLLLCACFSGQSELIKFLLDKGADPTVCTLQGDSALLLATFACCALKGAEPQLIDLLACRGLNANAQNNNGDSPLSIAALHGKTRLVSILLQYGADPCIPNARGVLPVDFAGSSGNLETAKLLENQMNAL